MNDRPIWKHYELPVYHNNRMSDVLSFSTAKERDEYKQTHPMTGEWSYEKDYTN